MKAAAPMLALIIGGVLVIVILGSFMPQITNDFLGINASETNISGASATLAGLIPLLMVIITVIGLLGAAGLKVVGKI